MTPRPDHPALWRARTVRQRWRKRRNAKKAQSKAVAATARRWRVRFSYRAPCRGAPRRGRAHHHWCPRRESSRLIASGRAVARRVLPTGQRRDTQQLKS